MKRSSYALLGALTLVAGLASPAAASTPAESSTPTETTDASAQLLGGTVYNGASSGRSLRIGHHWCGDSDEPSVGGPSCGGSGTGSDYAWLGVGQSSSSRWSDTDTLGVIGGCTLSTYVHYGLGYYSWTVSPRTTTWYKVHDIEYIEVRNYTC